MGTVYFRPSSSTGLLELPEVQCPKDVTSIKSKGWFIASCQPLYQVVFLAYPGWLILSVLQGGKPKLLAAFVVWLAPFLFYSRVSFLFFENWNTGGLDMHYHLRSDCP
jgi:hypothetical protein